MPKIHRKEVGEVLPKQSWPELEVEVEMARLTFGMGGPSALAPSRIVDLQSRELTPAEALRRLGKQTPVLVSVSGRMPHAYHLQLTRPDEAGVILGSRDDIPAPGSLPAEKTHCAKSDKAGAK